MTDAPAPQISLPGTASPLRRFTLAAVLLALLGVLFAPFFVDPIDHTSPRAANGVVSFERYGPLNAPVNLAGDWRLTWLTPPAPGAVVPVPVPGDWSGPHPGGPTLPYLGTGAYHLRIQGLRPGRYVLFIAHGFHAIEVSLNGHVVSRVGVLGLSAATSRSVHRSKAITFESDGSDLDLTIDVASFQHREAGLGTIPVLGLEDPMSRWIALDWVQGLEIGRAHV